MKAEDQFTYILLAIQFSAAINLFIAQRLVSRFGKKATFFAGEGVMLAVMGTIFFLPEGYVPVLYVYAVLSGMGVSVSMLIPWSMLPDVIDEDEWKTGNRREGDYYSIFLVFQKVGLGIATAASSFALGLAGYQSPDDQAAGETGLIEPEQPASVILTLKLLVGFIPFGLMLVSVATMYFYPITREKHAQIMKDLQDRRRIEEEKKEESKIYDKIGPSEFSEL